MQYLNRSTNKSSSDVKELICGHFLFFKRLPSVTKFDHTQATMDTNLTVIEYICVIFLTFILLLLLRLAFKTAPGMI